MIFLWSVQKLISWPLCLMSMTAIIVFPAPVFNTAIVFRLFATSNTSSWYLSTWKYTCTYVHMNILVKFTTFHLIKIYLYEKILKNKEKKWKNLLGKKCLELWEVGDSWGEWSRRALRRLVSVLEAMPLKLLFLREVWKSWIVECIFMLYNIWDLTHNVKNS